MTPHQRAREIASKFTYDEHLGLIDAIAAALEEEREATVREVYQAIHALHKGSTLEHCWYQACECEKIWKEVKAVVLLDRQRKGAR